MIQSKSAPGIGVHDVHGEEQCGQKLITCSKKHLYSSTQRRKK